MLKILKTDSDRIVRNLKSAVELHSSRNDYRMVAKVTYIAMRDMWLCAHELKWEKKRAAFAEYANKYNFECVIKQTIDQL